MKASFSFYWRIDRSFQYILQS